MVLGRLGEWVSGAHALCIHSATHDVVLSNENSGPFVRNIFLFLRSSVLSQTKPMTHDESDPLKMTDWSAVHRMVISGERSKLVLPPCIALGRLDLVRASGMSVFSD